MKTAVYVRVSSDKQTTDSQQPDLNRWILASGDEAVWFEDTFTGTTMNRPGFNDLMEQVRAGKIKQILIWRLDRLGRTASQLTQLFEEFGRLGVNLVSFKDGLDLSTAAGRLMANVLASVAQFETEVRKERVQAGIAQRKAAGTYVHKGGRKKGSGKAPPKSYWTMYKSGMRPTEIARIAKVSRFTVHRALKYWAAKNGEEIGAGKNKVAPPKGLPASEHKAYWAERRRLKQEAQQEADANRTLDDIVDQLPPDELAEMLELGDNEG